MKQHLIEEVVAEVRVTRRRYIVEPSRPSRPPPVAIETTAEEISGPMPALAKCGERVAEVIAFPRRRAS